MSDRFGPVVAINVEATGERGVFEATKVDAAELRVVHVPRTFTGDEVHEIVQGANAAILMILGRDPAPSDAPDLGSEYGRLLAERDRLIAEGADPADLETLLPPPSDAPEKP